MWLRVFRWCWRFLLSRLRILRWQWCLWQCKVRKILDKKEFNNNSIFSAFYNPFSWNQGKPRQQSNRERIKLMGLSNHDYHKEPSGEGTIWNSALFATGWKMKGNITVGRIQSTENGFQTANVMGYLSTLKKNSWRGFSSRIQACLRLGFEMDRVKIFEWHFESFWCLWSCCCWWIWFGNTS